MRHSITTFTSISMAVFAFVSVTAIEAAPHKHTERLVLAFYYTWYGTPEVSGAWRKWNEAGHKPGAMTPEGYPDIASANHPVELYDSSDPKVIERHLEQAKSAGIDALVTSWWGRGDYQDMALEKCHDIAEKGNSAVKLAVLYETVKPPKIEQAVGDLNYILEKHGSRSSHLRQGESTVLFVSAKALQDLGEANWRLVADQIRANRSVLLLAGTADTAWAETFDGLFGPAGDLALKSDGGTDESHIALVKAARRLNRIACANVSPGHDDSRMAKGEPHVIARAEGEFFRKSWNSALKAKPDWVVVDSFNQWHEGTEIEPSIENGEQYLNLSAECAREFKSAEFVAEELPPVFTRAEVVLGKVNDSTRLRQVELSDAASISEHRVDRECRRPAVMKTGDVRYIYFDVDEGLDLTRGVRVFVDYYDLAAGVVEIQYDSRSENLPESGRFKSSAKCTLAGDGYWKEYLFVLTEPRFEGRQKGNSDFRLAVLSGDLAVSRVRLESIPPLKPPDPTPVGVPPPPGYGRY